MDWIFWLILVIVLTIVELATVNLLTQLRGSPCGFS